MYKTKKVTSKEEDLIETIRIVQKLYGESKERQIATAYQLLDELLFPD